MWGAVHAATASTPRADTVCLGPSELISSYRVRGPGLGGPRFPFSRHQNFPLLTAAVAPVNMGGYRLLPPPKPPSKLQRVGEHVGTWDLLQPEVTPTPTPISVEPKEVLRPLEEPA